MVSFNVMNIAWPWLKYLIVVLLGIALTLNTTNSFLCVKDMKKNDVPFISRKPHGGAMNMNRPIIGRDGGEDNHHVTKEDEYYQ